ncbi:MAG: type II secretion system protein [Candidatus Hydrogenedens sp.]|jgi:prepilin-type N-terminal cleavage/methylation domain-containing protein|nr:type II secretion system protein [Candidatus Hydrogenedens sp.]
MRNKSFKSGFTLLELLIAMTVLVAIVGIVYSSFSSVTMTMGLARVDAERLRFRQILWRSFSQNLQSVYVDAACLQPEYGFIGENKDSGFGPADTLRFVSALPMPGAGALPGIYRVVSYTVTNRAETDSAIAASLPLESENSNILLIREEPFQLESQGFFHDAQGVTGDVFEQAVPVASMDVQYFDSGSNEWVDDWDSSEERRLPGGVWIKVNFARSDEDRHADYAAGIDLNEHPDFEFMMSFPLGRNVEYPFPDFNHLRYLSDEGF